jgi:hypothetical protein
MWMFAEIKMCDKNCDAVILCMSDWLCLWKSCRHMFVKPDDNCIQ